MPEYAFTLDEVGGAEVLKELAADDIAAYMQRIANIIGPEAVVEIAGGARRARAKVTVPAYMQAKDGVLTRAVAEVGLEFKPSKQRAPKPKRESKTATSKSDKARKTTSKKTTTTAARRTKKKPSK